MTSMFRRFIREHKAQINIVAMIGLLLGVIVAVTVLRDAEDILDQGINDRIFDIVNENITLIEDTNVSLANTNLMTGVILFNSTADGLLGITEDAECSSEGSCNATVWLLDGRVQANSSIGSGNGSWPSFDNTTLVNYTYTRLATAQNTPESTKVLSELIIGIAALVIILGIIRSLPELS